MLKNEMTVRELKAILEEYDNDLRVFLWLGKNQCTLDIITRSGVVKKELLENTRDEDDE